MVFYSSMNQRSALATVFLAVLIDLMGFGIVLPLLPFYASAFSAPPAVIGLLYSIYSFAQLIFSPVWGGISDRIGRRPIMLLSTLGASFAYVLFGLAHTLPLLFLSRLIAGIMGGNISTAQAYVADVTSHEERAKGMGLIGAAFGVGFVLGPAIAAVLIHPSFLKLAKIAPLNKYSVPGFFAAFLSLLSFLLVFFKLPETVKQREGDNRRIAKFSIFSKSFWRTLTDHRASGIKFLFPLLMGCVFLYSFAQSSLYSSFPLFCEWRLKLSEAEIGMLYAYLGTVAILIQGGFIRVLVKKFGEENLFFTGSILMSAGFGLVPFAPSLPYLFLFLGILSFGMSLAGPTMNSLISKEAGPSEVGRALGASQGIGALGRVVGPAWGGWLYGLGPALPFFATASGLLYAVRVGSKLVRHKRSAS